MKVPFAENQTKHIVLTPIQQELHQTIINNKITVISGPAGTAKTFTALYTALHLLRKGVVDKIILTKPLKEAGEKLGFLKGGIKEKLQPFVDSFDLTIEKIIKGDNIVDKLEQQGLLEKRPLAFMRGSTFDRSIMILDEAQNADLRQLMLFITRMGVDSKVIIAGDVTQYDIAYNLVALPKLVNLLTDPILIADVDVFEFKKEHIMRDKILIEITERYDYVMAKELLKKQEQQKKDLPILLLD